MLKDEQKLSELGLANGGKLYFKDLGPQVGWTTVSEIYTFLVYGHQCCTGIFGMGIVRDKRAL